MPENMLALSICLQMIINCFASLLASAKELTDNFLTLILSFTQALLVRRRRLSSDNDDCDDNEYDKNHLSGVVMATP